MTWFGYFLIAWWVMNVALTVGVIGKPRKPLEPAAGAVIVLINALLIWGVVAVGTNQ